MAQPITWRSVGGPNFSDSNNLRAASIAGVQNSINGLQALAANTVRGREAAAATEQDNLTQGVLNQIQGIGSLEQYNKLNAGGNFSAEQLAAAGLNQQNIGKALTQFQGRDNVLRTDQTSENAFNDQVATQAEKPINIAAQSLLAGRDYTGLEKLLEDNPTLSNSGQLRNSIIEQQRGDATNEYNIGQRDIKRGEEEQSRLVDNLVGSAVQAANSSDTATGRSVLADALGQLNLPVSLVNKANSDFITGVDAGNKKTEKETKAEDRRKAGIQALYDNANEQIAFEESRTKLNAPKSAEQKLTEDSAAIDEIVTAAPEESFLRRAATGFSPLGLIGSGVTNLYDSGAFGSPDLTKSATKDLFEGISQGNKAYEYNPSGDKIIGIKDYDPNTDDPANIVKLTAAQLQRAATGAKDPETGKTDRDTLYNALINTSTQANGERDVLSQKVLNELRGQLRVALKAEDTDAIKRISDRFQQQSR